MDFLEVERYFYSFLHSIICIVVICFIFVFSTRIISERDKIELINRIDWSEISGVFQRANVRILYLAALISSEKNQEDDSAHIYASIEGDTAKEKANFLALKSFFPKGKYLHEYITEPDSISDERSQKSPKFSNDSDCYVGSGRISFLKKGDSCGNDYFMKISLPVSYKSSSHNGNRLGELGVTVKNRFYEADLQTEWKGLLGHQFATNTSISFWDFEKKRWDILWSNNTITMAGEKLFVRTYVKTEKLIAWAASDFIGDAIAFILALTLIYIFFRLGRRNINLKTMVDYDHLTGALSRYRIEQICNIVIDFSKKNNVNLCIIAIDIDHFKKINDSYGHAVGDRVLHEFSSIVIGSIHNGDYFARVGGEEFILVIKGNSIDGERIALRLKESLNRYDWSTIGVLNGGVTASYGCTNLHENDDYHSLKERADSLLYFAKNSGRNCIKTSQI
ncbi:GGDEF domain-containing protein [Chitinibacter fontanus]|uniref:diguanylate cyclase n=1 Tax=Chitinibacter fontanus TaxID=1737446 RepID=A0A7D5ZEW0_9NEIS|nr:GGDEF domain-containing protein [Chitinibacter fontanus]QLI82286.1 GGDEF domain-containing protein [Chitinibacter fontanus]